MVMGTQLVGDETSRALTSLSSGEVLQTPDQIAALLRESGQETGQVWTNLTPDDRVAALNPATEQWTVLQACQ